MQFNLYKPNPLPFSSLTNKDKTIDLNDSRRKILICIDGSESSLAAYTHTIKNIARDQDLIVLLTCVEESSISAEFYQDYLHGTTNLPLKINKYATSMMHEYSNILSRMKPSLDIILMVIIQSIYTLFKMIL